MNEERPSRETTLKSRSSSPWLKMLEEGRQESYQGVCQSVEDQYANLEKMRGSASTLNDAEFKIFWANLQVLRPSIYSRPPIPEISPRFKDRKPLPRRAADIVERALTTDFELDDLHSTLIHARDDLAMNARGVVWIREGERDGFSAPIAEHIDRDDFRHGPAKKWADVPWVSRCSWVDERKFEERFKRKPYEKPDSQSEEVRKSRKGKVPVWEIWHKGEGLVVWVTEGIDDVLDVKDPWLDLQGFFPCPKPAYGTLQPRSLLPVPDLIFYQSQVDEICNLTRRIHGLLDALRVKGFYAAGAEDIGDALETSLQQYSDEAMLVPVASLHALGGNGMDKAIVWWPIDQIAVTVRELIGNRQQLVADVYEISGLSDIMRGSTDPNETLGAQQLKSQYGSIRVQERQAEMQRLARDVTRMKAEILSEKTPFEVLLQMAQVDDLLPAAEIEAQAMAQLQQASMQGPEAAEQATQQIQAQMKEAVSLEEVQQLLADQKVRPFILDIETDSTVAPDEAREKQDRVEFTTAVGQFIQQAAPLVMQARELGPFAAETLVYLAGGFRASRRMDAAVDELADQLRQYAQAPKQPSPEQQAEERKQNREDALAEAQIAKMQADANPPAEPVSVDPLDRAKVQQQDRKLDMEQDALALKMAQAAAQVVAQEDQSQEAANG